MVDEEVISIIEYINKSPNFYTTSSCSGRLIIISKMHARSKHSVNFLFKTHNPPELSKIQQALKNSFSDQLWLILEPPVLHIGTRTISDAKILLKTALESGLGLSMIKSISKIPIVEIRGTGRIEMPIGFKGKMSINNNYLLNTIDLVTKIMKEDKKRVDIWTKTLQSNLYS